MNTQKGFVFILIIILGVVVLGGGVYFYKNPIEENQRFNVENKSNVSTTTSEQVEFKNGKATYNTQEEMNAGRAATAEYYAYIESGVIPNGWVKEEIKTNNGRILTFILPQEYKEVIYSELINRTIDSKPENEDLKYIGGSVSDIKEYKIYAGGVEKKVIKYSYVTSTNYKWNVYEVDMGSSMHLELGYTYKTELDNPKISQITLDRIIGSISL